MGCHFPTFADFSTDFGRKRPLIAPNPLRQHLPEPFHPSQPGHRSQQDQPHSGLADAQGDGRLRGIPTFQQPEHNHITLPVRKLSQCIVDDLFPVFSVGLLRRPLRLVEGLRHFAWMAGRNFGGSHAVFEVYSSVAAALADRHRPCRERTPLSVAVQILQNLHPAVLKQVVRFVVALRKAPYRHPDARTEDPDQLSQQFRITGVKALKIEVICNWSAPSPVDGQPGFPSSSS